MKKREMTKLTLAALAASLCTVSHVSAVDQNVSEHTILTAGCKNGCSSSNPQRTRRNDGSVAENESNRWNQNNGQIASIESDFRDQLNDKSKDTFDNMDADGKALAIQLGNNMSDKNEAVKQASAKMNQSKKNNGY
jgi:hypothetical protein